MPATIYDLPPLEGFRNLVHRLLEVVQARRAAGLLNAAAGNLGLFWLTIRLHRFRRLTERLEAGKLPPPYRPRPPAPPKASPPATDPPETKPPARPPARRWGWLREQVGAERAPNMAGMLGAYLNHPGLPALAAQAPAAVARSLRPFCYALGVEVPAWLPPIPRKPRIPARPKPWQPPPPRPPKDMRTAIRLAWPGLRRPPRLHLDCNKAELEAWLDKHSLQRRRERRYAELRAKREAKIAAWDAQYGPNAAPQPATGPPDTIPKRE